MGKRKGVFGKKKWKKMYVIILIYFYSEYLTSFWKLNYIKQGRETVFIKGGHGFLKDESTALKKTEKDTHHMKKNTEHYTMLYSPSLTL